MNKEDVFLILGVNDGDSKEYIKARYGKLTLKWLKNETKFTEKEMDQIGEILAPIIGDWTEYSNNKNALEAEEQNKKIRRKFLLDIIKYVLLFVISIKLLIFLWNIHVVLGIIGIVIFFWLVNNKNKTGYFLGNK